jgi:hypothetical protein
MIALLALIEIMIVLMICIQNNYANVDLIVEIAEAQKVDGERTFSMVFVIFIIGIELLGSSYELSAIISSIPKRRTTSHLYFLLTAVPHALSGLAWMGPRIRESKTALHPQGEGYSGRGYCVTDQADQEWHSSLF